MGQALGSVELGSVELRSVGVSSQCQSVAIRVLQLFLECPSSFLNVSRCEGIPCAFLCAFPCGLSVSKIISEMISTLISENILAK